MAGGHRQEHARGAGAERAYSERQLRWGRVIAASPEETMKKHFQTVAFVAVLALGTLVGIRPSTAADRVPGPEATSGASGSTSWRANYDANYRANYHADYRAKGTDDRSSDTEESPSRRDGQSGLQPDWRIPPSAGYRQVPSRSLR